MLKNLFQVLGARDLLKKTSKDFSEFYLWIRDHICNLSFKNQEDLPVLPKKLQLLYLNLTLWVTDRKDIRLDDHYGPSWHCTKWISANNCKVVEKLILRVAITCLSSLSVVVLSKLFLVPYMYSNSHWEFVMICAQAVSWNGLLLSVSSPCLSSYHILYKAFAWLWPWKSPEELLTPP